MTYFHRRPSTIIGAKAFHCPVRDGKEWYHLAMVVKRNGFATLRISVPHRTHTLKNKGVQRATIDSERANLGKKHTQKV